MPSFIETQFPIARLSAESYKERKAITSQTLTCFSKWWGRKPLILVRAVIMGMLMPSSNDPKRDREIFLKILTMDDDGVWLRQKGEIPASAWREAAPVEIQEEYFNNRGFQPGLSDEEKEEVCERIWELLDDVQRKNLEDLRRRPVPDRLDFDALPYAERIRFCERPEHVEGPGQEAWREINDHLKTNATKLSELVEELSMRTFGHCARVGDSFCGGGSIPFEAARIGCDSFGSDLNPVATLLTWAGLKVLGAGRPVQDQLRKEQMVVFKAAEATIREWGIESNGDGEQADAFLYCVEVRPEGCDYYIPLAPSWVVSENKRIFARWKKVTGSDKLECEIIDRKGSQESLAEFKAKVGELSPPTAVDGRVIDPFNSDRSWSIESLRGLNGLRLWTNDDIMPRCDDLFQERLYCVRWVKKVPARNGKLKTVRRFAAPDQNDLDSERRVLELLRVRFSEWQRKGFIPSKAIPEGGEKTEEPIRTRGWTHWHHLFTPRQLLVHGLFAELTSKYSIAHWIRIGNLADFDSRLARYAASQDSINNTFSNQALNTLYNYPNRTMLTLGSAYHFKGSHPKIDKAETSIVQQIDARDISTTCDLWITDPPYADAVNYHELGDYFLAWYDKHLKETFPDWTPDARAQLAVRGNGEDFTRSMVEIYRNLANHMPDNGMQMVMFTHQNPAVWADLGMILWAAGLTATAAWTISTETEAAGIKKGNYVQGTVCLVLRKRASNEPGFLDEVYPLVEDEVKRQIESMQALDEDGEPNFNDADYQLAAYAAALKVLTQYGNLDGRDVEHEVFAVRAKNQKSDFEAVIERALGIACDFLVPRGLDGSWRDLSLVERYYLRALDIESRGERRKGMYEELARGFGVNDIRPLLKTDKANGARMLTPSGFAASGLAPLSGGSTEALPARRGRVGAGAPHPFAASPLRHLLFAIRETTAADNSPEPGRQYLRDTFGQGYWGQREGFIGLLEWLAALGNAQGMAEWVADSEAARILAGRLRNDHA